MENKEDKFECIPDPKSDTMTCKVITSSGEEFDYDILLEQGYNDNLGHHYPFAKVVDIIPRRPYPPSFNSLQQELAYALQDMIDDTYDDMLYDVEKGYDDSIEPFSGILLPTNLRRYTYKLT